MPFELKSTPERPPEQPALPEQGERPEVRVETPAERPMPPEKVTEQAVPTTAPVSHPAVTAADATSVNAIETILAEDLSELYAALDPVTRDEFRKKGEETARAIQPLLQQVKVQARKIIRLLTNWLKMIPGVSALFIEQEAKIKADRLLALKRNRDEGQA
jgi:hypothetical protein